MVTIEKLIRIQGTAQESKMLLFISSITITKPTKRERETQTEKGSRPTTAKRGHEDQARDGTHTRFTKPSIGGRCVVCVCMSHAPCHAQHTYLPKATTQYIV